MQLESLWLAVANHLWQCLLVLVPLFVLAWLLRAASARTQNLLWWVTAMKLLLPLSVLGSITVSLIDAVWPGRGGALALAYDAGPVAAWIAPAEIWVVPGSASSSAVDLFLWVTVAWVGGGLALLVRWARRRHVDRGLSSLDGADPEVRRRIESALTATPIPTHAVVVSDSGSMPAVVGLRRPRVLVPLALVEHLPADELRAVLLHEAAHFHRRDTLRAAALKVLLLAFYYFPPLWIVARKIRDTTELACDEWAVERGVPRDVFVRALARTVQLVIGTSPETAAAGDGSRSLLRRRIERVRDWRRDRDMLRHYVVLASAILLVAVASFYPFAPSWMVLAGEQEQSRELAHLAGGDMRTTLNFERQDCLEVIKALGKSVPYEVEVEGELPQPMRIVSIDMTYVTAVEVLERIAALTGISYRVPDPHTLVVAAPHVPGVDGVTNPRIIPESRVVPTYPETARKRGIGGKVILEARLDEHGFVERVKVLSGIPDYPEFEEAAIAAIMQWRYDPATKDGEPVPVLFTVVIQFRLDEHEESKAPVAL